MPYGSLSSLISGDSVASLSESTGVLHRCSVYSVAEQLKLMCGSDMHVLPFIAKLS